MLQTRINQYILREILSPTLLCLLIFTMVIVLGRAFKLVELVINKGVSLSNILILLGTLLPTFFIIILPLSFLMGIMIGLGRMSADSETIAMKANGISLFDISKPVLALAVVFAILTGVTGVWLKPWGYNAFKRHIFEISQQKVTIGIQPKTFLTYFDKFTLYTNRIDHRSGIMKKVFIVEKKPESTSLIFADSGRISTDEEARTITFLLQDGVVHQQKEGDDSSYRIIHFQNYSVQPQLSSVDEPTAPARKKEKNPNGISTSDLWHEISSTDDQARRSALQAELHLRLSSAVSPLLLAIFGLPFGIQSQRSGRSGGFVMGLFIFLAYYLVVSLGDSLTTGGLNPVIATWVPHALLLLAGGHLLYRSSMEEPNKLLTIFENAKTTLNRVFRAGP